MGLNALVPVKGLKIKILQFVAVAVPREHPLALDGLLRLVERLARRSVLAGSSLETVMTLYYGSFRCTMMKATEVSDMWIRSCQQ